MAGFMAGLHRHPPAPSFPFFSCDLQYVTSHSLVRAQYNTFYIPYRCIIHTFDMNIL